MGVRSAAAEDFARALDHGRPEQPATALLEALATARAALEVRPALAARSAPRPEFRDALRARLVAVAAVRPAVDPTVRSSPRPPWARLSGPPSHPVSRRLAACTAGLACLVALAGVVVGASRSLPGQPLYPAKRATEAFELRTADGPLEEGLRHLRFAESRLREVRALAAGQGSLAVTGAAGTGTGVVLTAGVSADQITTTLAAMDAQTRTGGGLVEQAARASGNATPLAVLEQWSGEQAGRLRAILPTLPGGARARAEASVSLVAGLGAGAGALLAPGCLPLGVEAPAPSCPPPGSVVPH